MTMRPLHDCEQSRWTAGEVRELLDAHDALEVENKRLRAAIEQHRRDYADAIGPQTKARGEMNRKKRDAAHRLWEAIGERPRGTSMDWDDLDPQTREAADQLLARGFDSAAVRLVVRQTGCTALEARELVGASRSSQPAASVGSWAVR